MAKEAANAEQDSGLSGGLLKELDSLGFGCVILNQQGRVIEANQRAGRHFGRNLEIRRDTLDAGPVSRAAAGMFREALRSAQAMSLTGYIIALPREDRKPLLLGRLRIGAEAPDQPNAFTAAIVLLDLDDCPSPSVELLKQLFGLSSAEARLAQRLSCGAGLVSISRACGVSVATLRMQLKAVFWKTGTHRQAELAALLAHLAGIARA